MQRDFRSATIGGSGFKIEIINSGGEIAIMTHTNTELKAGNIVVVDLPRVGRRLIEMKSVSNFEVEIQWQPNNRRTVSPLWLKSEIKKHKTILYRRKGRNYMTITHDGNLKKQDRVFGVPSEPERRAGDMRAEGTTFREIGIALGVCTERASMLYQSYERHLSDGKKWYAGLTARGRRVLVCLGIENKEAFRARVMDDGVKWLRKQHGIGKKTIGMIVDWGFNELGEKSSDA